MELKPDQLSIEMLQRLLQHDDLELRHKAIGSMSLLIDRYPLLLFDEKQVNALLIEETSYNNMLLNAFLLKSEQADTGFEMGQELINTIRQKIDKNLAVIFSLLNIKYPPEEYLEIYNYVQSSDQVLRNNAIEYLENTLGNDLKKIIIPLLDIEIPGHQKERSEFKPIDASKLKNFLFDNRDEDIRKAAKKYYEG